MTEPRARQARFLTRNAVDALPEGALERQLAGGRPLRVKLGIDPTAPDIHLGHTVVLRKLREFQDLGHTVVLIIGDYTGARGRPERPLRDPARALGRGDRRQRRDLPARRRSRVLDRDRTEVRRNGEWLDMPMEDLFRLARTSTVAQLLERDDFAKRYAARRADLDPRAALPAAAGLRLGGDPTPTSSSAAPTRSSTSCSARDIQQAYGQAAAVDPHDADPARAPTASRRCPSRSATTSA